LSKSISIIEGKFNTPEAYRLNINSDGVEIEASSTVGAFYGNKE